MRRVRRKINASAPSACRYFVLAQQKEKWEDQEGRGRKEKEELNQQIQKNRLLQQENLQLKSDVDRYDTHTHTGRLGAGLPAHPSIHPSVQHLPPPSPTSG